MPNLRRKKLVTALFVGVLALTACGHKKTRPSQQAPVPPGSPSPTASITATPQTVDKGDAVVLVWRTTDANDVSIDGIGAVKPNDQLMTAPAATTTYHLIARGDGGSTDASVTVTVNGPAAPPPPPPSTSSATSNDLSSSTTDAVFHQNVQDIFFDYDSYDVRPDAQTAISQAAAWLNSHPGVKVVVGGYCDDRGSTEYNIALGENRANAARASLTKAGVDPGRMRVVSFGKEKQFCSDETESCWQQNRRAAFQIDK